MRAQVEGLHALNGLSCGGLHGLAQQQTGQLLAWGANQNGVLGLGSELIQSQRGPMPLQKTFASQVLILCSCQLSQAGSTRLLGCWTACELHCTSLGAGQLPATNGKHHGETWLQAQMAAAFTRAFSHTTCRLELYMAKLQCSYDEAQGMHALPLLCCIIVLASLSMVLSAV